ncbi:copper resistance protein NlpE [Vibrio sp. FNV 38]|nr:copper resistance protein NlpE [Vibrio sp. FNV 38]
MKLLIIPALTLPILLLGCQDSNDVNTANQDPTPMVEAIVKSEAQHNEIIDQAHNARNALDWFGTYQGTLPCADCAGIDITLILNMDGSYALDEQYEGKSDGHFESTGNFSWNETGTIVSLDNKSLPNQFFVAEGRLIKLDMNGEKVTGDLAEHYQLVKVTAQ